MWPTCCGLTIGQQANIGDVYLPLVPDGTLQAVSQTEDTEIGFAPSVLVANPEFAGVKLMVPANSLYSDDGNRGGKVGIAPVSPDRLPGQLPQGLDFPVVITVQTDGATNFDAPVPICFPNLPDPNLGVPLEPDTKDALFSFSHDTGRWEAVGTMTVTADGQFVCTDPGSGILAPGWHGNGPLPQTLPPPPKPPCPLNPDKFDGQQDATIFFGICIAGAAVACTTGFGCPAAAIGAAVCTADYMYEGRVKCERIPHCAPAASTEPFKLLTELDGNQSTTNDAVRPFQFFNYPGALV